MGTTTNSNVRQASQPQPPVSFVYVVMPRSYAYNDEYYKFNEDGHSGAEAYRKPVKVFLNKSEAQALCAELEATERTGHSPRDFGDCENNDWDDVPDFYEVIEVPAA